VSLYLIRKDGIKLRKLENKLLRMIGLYMLDPSETLQYLFYRVRAKEYQDEKLQK
jgi:hypothetical protein